MNFKQFGSVFIMNKWIGLVWFQGQEIDTNLNRTKPIAIYMRKESPLMYVGKYLVNRKHNQGFSKPLIRHTHPWKHYETWTFILWHYNF